VRCARRNIGPAGGHVHAGDLFEPLPAALRGRVDILAANVPYVPTGEVGLLPAEARLHEPLVALDGGGDGLDVLRRVAAQARLWLAPGGGLLAAWSHGWRGPPSWPPRCSSPPGRPGNAASASAGASQPQPVRCVA
jgi:release factor glutamine methyltransferase